MNRHPGTPPPDGEGVRGRVVMPPQQAPTLAATTPAAFLQMLQSRMAAIRSSPVNDGIQQDPPTPGGASSRRLNIKRNTPSARNPTSQTSPAQRKRSGQCTPPSPVHLPSPHSTDSEPMFAKQPRRKRRRGVAATSPNPPEPPDAADVRLPSDVSPSASPSALRTQTKTVQRLHPIAGSQKQQKRLQAHKITYPEGVWVAAGEDPRVAVWVPPPSPFSLLEEVLYQDPWALLLACILLNKTSALQVRRVLGVLLRMYGTPAALASVGTEGTAGAMRDLETKLHPLGLFRSRARRLVRFSQEYLNKQWCDPRELHGVGRYGADAYALFCRGAWRLMPCPEDKDLRRYWEWIHATSAQEGGRDQCVAGHSTCCCKPCLRAPNPCSAGGQGEGLQRESLQHVLQGAGPSAQEQHESCAGMTDRSPQYPRGCSGVRGTAVDAWEAPASRRSSSSSSGGGGGGDGDGDGDG